MSTISLPRWLVSRGRFIVAPPASRWSVPLTPPSATHFVVCNLHWPDPSLRPGRRPHPPPDREIRQPGCPRTAGRRRLSVPSVSARRHALEASRTGIRRRDTGGSEGLAVCQRSLSWAAGGSRSRLRRRRRAWCAARAWLCVQRTAAKGRKGSTCCPKRAKLRSLCSRCTIESSFRTDVRLTAQRRSRNHGRYFAWCGPDLRPMTTSDRNAPKSRPAISPVSPSA